MNGKYIHRNQIEALSTLLRRVLSPVFSYHPELSLSVPLSLSALHSFVYRNNSVFLFVILSLSLSKI